MDNFNDTNINNSEELNSGEQNTQPNVNDTPTSASEHITKPPVYLGATYSTEQATAPQSTAVEPTFESNATQTPAVEPTFESNATQTPAVEPTSTSSVAQSNEFSYNSPSININEATAYNQPNAAYNASQMPNYTQSYNNQQAVNQAPQPTYNNPVQTEANTYNQAGAYQHNNVVPPVPNPSLNGHFNQSPSNYAPPPPYGQAPQTYTNNCQHTQAPPRVNTNLRPYGDNAPPPAYGQAQLPPQMQPYPPQNYGVQGQVPPNFNPNYPTYVKPPKPPMNKGVLALIITGSVLAFLAIGGFLVLLIAGFIAGFSQTTIVTQPPSGFEEFFEGYEDYYGEDESEENPFIAPWQEGTTPEDGIEIEEPEDIPDINVPDNTDGLTLYKRPTSSDLSPQQVYDKVIDSTVTINVEITYSDGTVEESGGTGIFITKDGFILTNSHVVGNTKKALVEVLTSNGESHPAVVVGYDKGTDLAVLKIDGSNYQAAEFGASDEMEIGDWVMAIGNPGGEEFSGSITRGIISGIDRAVGYQSAENMPYIQTDAAINPGNSGGPLVNMHGQVIGINTSKIVADYYEGMGFAIPTEEAKNIVDDLLEKGYVSGRVRLGITARNIDSGTAMMHNIDGGIEIVEIADDSSFSGTEIQVGDIIIAIDGEPIYDMTHLSELLVGYSPGEVIDVTVVRGSQSSKEITTSITLLEDAGQTQE